jgi:hypothetical protein
MRTNIAVEKLQIQVKCFFKRQNVFGMWEVIEDTIAGASSWVVAFNISTFILGLIFD